jgi:hypothetical protein
VDHRGHVDDSFLTTIRHTYYLHIQSHAGPRKPFLPAAISLGLVEYEGGTSSAAFCVKKFRGLKRTLIGSAGWQDDR